MSAPQIFSRAYLQGIPELRKQQHIDELIDQHISMIQTKAANGKTSYMYRPYEGKMMVQQIPPLAVFTNDDLVQAFKLRFPDCEISYQETWVDVHTNQKILKKGILIDWS